MEYQSQTKIDYITSRGKEEEGIGRVKGNGGREGSSEAECSALDLSLSGREESK